MKIFTVARDTRGFTLVELIVVMAIFVTVIAITGNAFNLIVQQSVKQSKTASSNIEGVIGLEVMRRDVASAGFGLPWSCPFTAVSDVYDEVDASEALASGFNDAQATPMMPRAVSAGNNLTPGNVNQLLEGTDYLVIRATSIGATQTAQRWSYMNYTGMVRPNPIQAKSWTSENLVNNDQVIVVRMDLAGAFSKDLVLNGSNFSTTYGALGNFEPQASKVTHYVYGVSSQDPNVATLRMPFNRADYFVRTPAAGEAVQMPNRCAPNTGILFKGLVNQKDGTFDDTAGNARANEMPLLDCVADMQVVYTLQSSSSGVVTDTDTLTDTTTLQPLTAEQIRTELKTIQVYILTHEAGLDRSYTYPNTNQFIAVGPSTDGINTGTGRSFDLATIIGAGWQNYRWKVYRMIVNPTNMYISTQ